VLHDFCMAIPYGAIIGATGEPPPASSPTPAPRALPPPARSPPPPGRPSAGLAGLLTGFGRSASLHLMGLGAASLLLSWLSLSRWQARDSSAAFTAGNALLSAGLAYWMYLRARLGVTVAASKAVMYVSAAICAFLVYNLAAGGNPAKKDKAGGEPGGDPAAAAAVAASN